MTMIMVMMMTSIYFNYLMKPWAKANRCRAGTISCLLKDPCNVAIESEISSAKTEEWAVSVPTRHAIHGAISDYWMGVERHNVLFVERE